MSVDLREGAQPGMHDPHCIDRECPGCLPPIPPTVQEYRARQHGLDLSIFRRDLRDTA